MAEHEQLSFLTEDQVAAGRLARDLIAQLDTATKGWTTPERPENNDVQAMIARTGFAMRELVITTPGRPTRELHLLRNYGDMEARTSPQILFTRPADDVYLPHMGAFIGRIELTLLDRPDYERVYSVYRLGNRRNRPPQGQDASADKDGVFADGLGVIVARTVIPNPSRPAYRQEVLGSRGIKGLAAMMADFVSKGQDGHEKPLSAIVAPPENA